MVNTTFKKVLVASTIAGSLAFGSAAQAGTDGFSSWTTAAGKSVSSEMRYPAIAVLNGKEGTPTFKVKINRSGDVLSADLTKTSRSGVINAAAKRAIKRTDFPSVPADFEGEELTFSVQLHYALAYSAKEQRYLQRQGRVSSERIASNGAPMTASIEIAENQAD
ncbi:MAG: TonB family protein [Kordiimonas sp.]